MEALRLEDFRSIETHVNRPPSMLEAELRRERLKHCNRISLLRKTYPLRKWIKDRANLLGDPSVTFTTYGTLTISLRGLAVEDVIEHLAGPIHQRTNCFWRMTADNSVDLYSVRPIRFDNSTFTMSVAIYIYKTADCKVVASERTVTRKEVSYKIDCQATSA